MADPLPKEFEWSTLDLEDAAQVQSTSYFYGSASDLFFPQSKEVYELLSANYVEDHDAAFRFEYSAEFLRWCGFCQNLVLESARSNLNPSHAGR